MAQLTFPVTKPGLTVPVWLGLSGETIDAKCAAGQTPAPPVQARGLLDTAADVTAVAPWILQQLAVPATSTATTTTAGGQVKVKVYKIPLGNHRSRAGGSHLTQPDLLITESTTVLPDADVLIGLDVLLEIKCATARLALHARLLMGRHETARSTP